MDMEERMRLYGDEIRRRHCSGCGLPHRSCSCENIERANRRREFEESRIAMEEQARLYTDEIRRREGMEEEMFAANDPPYARNINEDRIEDDDFDLAPEPEAPPEERKTRCVHCGASERYCCCGCTCFYLESEIREQEQQRRAIIAEVITDIRTGEVYRRNTGRSLDDNEEISEELPQEIKLIGISRVSVEDHPYCIEIYGRSNENIDDCSENVSSTFCGHPVHVTSSILERGDANGEFYDVNLMFSTQGVYDPRIILRDVYLYIIDNDLDRNMEIGYYSNGIPLWSAENDSNEELFEEGFNALASYSGGERHVLTESEKKERLKKKKEQVERERLAKIEAKEEARELLDPIWSIDIQ